MKAFSLKNHFVGEAGAGGQAPAQESSSVGDDFCLVEGDGQAAGAGPAAGEEKASASEGAAQGEGGGLSGCDEIGPAWIDVVQGWKRGDGDVAESEEEEKDDDHGSDCASRTNPSATETLSTFTDVLPQEKAPTTRPQPVQASAPTSPPCRATIQLPLSREALERVGTIVLGLCLGAALVALIALTVSCIVPVCLDLCTALALHLTDLKNGEALRRELNAAPAESFAPSRRSLVRTMFPTHQFLVYGLHGAGKSTTLQNLALHAGLPPHEAWQFSVARGGGSSFTQEVKKARLGQGVSMFDSKGLPDWNLGHIDALEALVSGKTKVGCPMRWDLPAYEEVQETYKDCDGAYLWCSTRTRTKQAQAVRPPVDGSSGYDCDSRLEEPARGGAVHAALLIVRYPSEEEYESVNAQAKKFLWAMRDRMPQLFPVIAVTHLDGCMQGGLSAQECSDDLAEAMGFTELGSVFPLDATPNLDRRIQADKSIRPSQLTPIIRALRYKAFELYKRRLPQDDDL